MAHPLTASLYDRFATLASGLTVIRAEAVARTATENLEESLSTWDGPMAHADASHREHAVVA
jgi:hypothetical protein